MTNPAQERSEEYRLIPAEVLLGAMLRAEDRGGYQSLAQQMKWYGHRFEAGCDDRLAIEYRALQLRARDAFEHERVHGTGSLLKLDDPRNRSRR